jgi:SprB repeat
MKKFYFTFFISMLLPIGVIHAQVLRITASSTESTCSNNGQICVRTTGGHRPYQYELDRIGSNLHLSQTDSCFVGLSKGNYKIRVTDALNNKDSVMVAVLGNYVLPSLTATVAGSCVTLNVIGGRKPFRYYYSPLSGGQQIAINLVATDSTTQTICCLANNTYWFKMEDSCQNIYPFRITVPVVAPPTIRVDTTYVNDSLTISLIRSLYGEPPYQFKCVGDSRGERINSTGIFTGLKGCSFVVTITDRCGRTDSRTVDNVAALTFTLLCSNSDIGTASMSARGGMPPYIFTELNSNLTNTTGLFTKLPLHQPYRFRVTDSCGKTIDRDISPFTSSASWQGCPFTNQIQLHSYNPSSSYSGYSWYPITYTCMSCTPIVTLVDSGRGSNYGESNANFINVPAGTHHFKVSNHCGAIHELDVTTDTTDVYVYLNYRNCHNNQVLVTSNGNFFVLKNKLGVPIDSNGTGLFNLFTNDTVIISARRDGCEGHPEIRILPTQLSINAYLNCDARTITASSSGDSMLFVLKNKAGHPIDSNSIGIFNILTIDTFRVAVRNRSCLGNQITVYPPVVRDTAKFCLTLARNSNRYIWNMRLSPTSDVNRTHTYRLRGGPNAINLFDDHYYYCDFNNLLPGVYTLEYDCIAKTIILPVPDTSYQLQLTTEPSCPQTTTIVARYIRNQTWTHWAIQNNVSLCDTLSIHYALYDSYGNYLGSNYTGRFDLNELPNRLYQVSLLSNYSNYPLKIDTIRTPPYERAIVTASFDTSSCGRD